MIATPTFEKVVAGMIEARLGRLNTVFPAEVTEVDVKAGRCTVQPSLMRVDADGNAVKLPPLVNCPIGFYRAGSAAVYLPVKVGAKVEVKCSQRSLDLWLVAGGIVDPQDSRKHHIADAIVYPGLYDLGDPPADADPDNIVIINGDAQIILTPDGKFNVKGATEELFQIVHDLLALLQTVQTPTMLGPKTFLPTDITQIAAIQTRLDGMKL